MPINRVSTAIVFHFPLHPNETPMKTSILAMIFLSILLSGTASSQFGDDFGTNGKSGRLGPAKVHIQPNDWSIALPPPSENPSDIEQLRQKLEVRTTIELNENDTFEHLFNILKEKYGIQSIVDPRGAGALGITIASPVVREPFRLENVPLRRILRMILREQDLTYVIDEGFLQITSEDESKKYMKVKVYPVADLVFDPFAKPSPQWVLKPAFPQWAGQSRGGGIQQPPVIDPEKVKMVWEFQPDTTFDFSELMDIIEVTVSPDSWDEGADMMEFYPGLCLVVLQTDKVHDQLENLLAELRANRAEPEKKISGTKPTVPQKPVRRFDKFRRR